MGRRAAAAATELSGEWMTTAISFLKYPHFSAASAASAAAAVRLVTPRPISSWPPTAAREEQAGNARRRRARREAIVPSPPRTAAKAARFIGRFGGRFHFKWSELIANSLTH